MSALLPPPARQPAGTPVVHVLPAGTVLRRTHRPAHAADSFNPTPQPSVLAGGRFDSLDGDYGYTYLGATDGGSIAETVCRDLPLDGSPRLVPRARVRGRVVTSVEVVRDLEVLALHGAHLSQVHAPLALTKCDAGEYLVTRTWARALRSWLPQVAGFAYRSRHDEDELGYVLFDDRAGDCLRSLDDATPLDSGLGLQRLKRVLHAHNATLA